MVPEMFAFQIWSVVQSEAVLYFIHQMAFFTIFKFDWIELTILDHGIKHICLGYYFVRVLAKSGGGTSDRITPSPPPPTFKRMVDMCPCSPLIDAHGRALLVKCYLAGWFLFFLLFCKVVNSWTSIMWLNFRKRKSESGFFSFGSDSGEHHFYPSGHVSLVLNRNADIETKYWILGT